MVDHRPHDGRRRALLAAAAVLVVAGLALVLTGLAGVGHPPPQPGPDVASTDTATGPPDRDPAPTPAPGADDRSSGAAPAVAPPAGPAVDLGPILSFSEPVGLDIPSIGVHSGELVPLEVGADGVLPAPADYALPGWHTSGPAPGQLGPAVIAGHVDGPSGPAVFYRLGDLAVGDPVQVTRRDGTVATFTIDAVERYPKDAFPTSQVYGNTTDRAELRLITCGGDFDRSTGHYVDNVVAYAHLVA
jgi:hypothetical protein